MIDELGHRSRARHHHLVRRRLGARPLVLLGGGGVVRRRGAPAPVVLAGAASSSTTTSGRFRRRCASPRGCSTPSQLSELAMPWFDSLPISTYTLSLELCERCGWWDPAVIPEDWHSYLNCLFETGDEIAVHPIFLPTHRRRDRRRGHARRGEEPLRAAQAPLVGRRGRRLHLGPAHRAQERMALLDRVPVHAGAARPQHARHQLGRAHQHLRADGLLLAPALVRPGLALVDRPEPRDPQRAVQPWVP